MLQAANKKGSFIPALQVTNSGTVTDDVQKSDNQFFSNFNHSVPSLTSCDVRDICNLGSLESSNFPEELWCTVNQILDLRTHWDVVQNFYQYVDFPTLLKLYIHLACMATHRICLHNMSQMMS